MDSHFRKPRRLWTVLADGFRLAWRSLPEVWPACLLALALYAVAGPVITALTGEDPNDLGFGTPSDAEALVEGATAATLLGVYVALNVSLLLWITASFMGAMSRLAGIDVPAGPRAALGRVPAMLGAALLYGLAVVVAAGLLGGLLGVLIGWQTDFAALAVVGVVAYLAMLLVLAPGLTVLERAGPLQATVRSVRLVLPCWARVAGLLVLVVLLNVGVALVIGLIVTVLIHLVDPDRVATILAWAVNPVLATAFLVVGAGLVCSLYWDLRAREAGRQD
ncbi:MAG: hypothetical protein PVG91_03250 [Gammaproteobacteria bacterium]|jgi:hypothetical protein